MSLSSSASNRATVFLNAPLSSLAEQQLNITIADAVRTLGYNVYVPQEIIPPGTEKEPQAILEENLSAIDGADVIITVLDKPGLGVAFELGFICAIDKPVILFRSDKQDYLGKILEGIWEASPSTRKATTLNQLQSLLQTLQSEGFQDAPVG